MEKTKPPLLVLASASSRRQQLLREAGLDFLVHPTHTAEQSHGHPADICLANALAKARAAEPLHPHALILAADTLISFHGSIIGKPADLAHAERMLLSLCGQVHEVLTAVCIVHNSTAHAFVETSRVKLRPLTLEQVRRYHARIHPLDKAGAYAAQDDLGEAIEFIEGSKSNVIGLPLAPTLRLLQKFAISPKKDK